MNKKVLKEINDEISAKFKGIREDITPLIKKMYEMEDFKGKTVAHQVTLKKQVQAIQGEMENLRKALNETCDSLQAMNEKIAEMNPVHAGALKNEPVNMKEHDVPNQKMIATDEAVQACAAPDAQQNQQNPELSDLKKLEERVRSLEQKSMSEMGAQVDLGVNMPNELQLRERKRNNLIVFGLNGVSQDGCNDQELVGTLFDDLGIKINLEETSIFRVGRECTDGRRPIIIKLNDQETKSHILFKAKSLKNNAKWKGISIAHDLTKMQCQQAKAAEMQLRKTAHEKNALLTDAERSEKVWKIVGGRGNRHLVLAHVKQSPLA